MSRTINVYKSYSFRTKDPVIDELRELQRKSGLKDTAISESSGVSPTTIHAWFKGKTRKPQSATVEAAGRAMGFKRVWQRFTG